MKGWLNYGIYGFQSTLPSQGATALPRDIHFQTEFQSTLPSQGATTTPEIDAELDVISIHAPLTGSDSKYTHKIPL